MNQLLEQIREKNATAFTHSGKFHADDVFSAALLLYLNPEIQIERGSRVPEDYTGIVFDIGRGRYDHHQRDSRIRQNGIPYAAFGLLWEELGKDILGEELAQQFDEVFVQPLDQNDNTGEKNELADLIGNFNPVWDATGNSDRAFFRAVQVAGMILENKFQRYLGNERADKRVEAVLQKQEESVRDGSIPEEEKKILVLPEFIPCQRHLSETDIAFVIFPSNRGGYCIQPQKKEYSMNYKCSFPEEWLGLEQDELAAKTGLESAIFCHKGGFIMTTGTLEDAVRACKISMREFREEPVIVNLGGDTAADNLLCQLPHFKSVRIVHMDLPKVPELELQGIYGEVGMDKAQWKNYVKEQVRKILKTKPEAVYIEGSTFAVYPIIHALRKKHIPVLSSVNKGGKNYIVSIPSGS